MMGHRERKGFEEHALQYWIPDRLFGFVVVSVTYV